jgi:hypothetical protein
MLILRNVYGESKRTPEELGTQGQFIALVEGVVGGLRAPRPRLFVWIAKHPRQGTFQLWVKCNDEPHDSEAWKKSPRQRTVAIFHRYLAEESFQDVFETLDKLRLWELPLEKPCGGEDIYRLDTTLHACWNARIWKNEAPGGCVHFGSQTRPSEPERNRFQEAVTAVRRMADTAQEPAYAKPCEPRGYSAELSEQEESFRQIHALIHSDQFARPDRCVGVEVVARSPSHRDKSLEELIAELRTGIDPDRREHGPDQVRHWAAFFLGVKGAAAAKAVPELMRVVADENAGVREAVIAALGRIGPAALEAVGVIRQAMTDAEVSIRRAAAVALWGLTRQASECLPTLIGALEAGALDGLAAASIFGEMGTDAQPAASGLAAFYRRLRPFFRPCIAEALRKVDPRFAASVVPPAWAAMPWNGNDCQVCLDS